VIRTRGLPDRTYPESMGFEPMDEALPRLRDESFVDTRTGIGSSQSGWIPATSICRGPPTVRLKILVRPIRSQ
jgi:hypothetical protein